MDATLDRAGDRTDDEHIRFEPTDGVAVVTLHRPEQMNAFTGLMGEELGDAYRRCDADDDVRVLVVTGAGRVFCAGADMAAGAETFTRSVSHDWPD